MTTKQEQIEITSYVVTLLNVNPSISVRGIKKKLLSDFDVRVSVGCAFNYKRLALKYKREYSIKTTETATEGTVSENIGQTTTKPLISTDNHKNKDADAKRGCCGGYVIPSLKEVMEKKAKHNSKRD